MGGYRPVYLGAIDNQRQCSSVTGYPGRSSGMQNAVTGIGGSPASVLVAAVTERE